MAVAFVQNESPFYKPYKSTSLRCDEKAAPLLEKIDAVTAALDRAATLQDSINIRIFTRITPAHGKWGEELSSSFSLDALEVAIKDYEERLLHLSAAATLEKSEESALSQAFQKMQLVDQHFFCVKEENTLLQTKLYSGDIKKALLLHNETIRQCDAITADTAMPPPEKLARLAKLFQTNLQQLVTHRKAISHTALKRLEVHEIQSLHILTLEFFSNAFTHLEKKHALSEHRLMPLMKKNVQEALEECKKPEAYNLKALVAIPPSPKLPVNGPEKERYLEACKRRQKELPAELHSEAASWMQGFIRRITDSVDPLTVQANYLHCIYTDIQHCVDSLSKKVSSPKKEEYSPPTNAHFYELLLTEIQEELKKQKNGLYTSPEMTEKVIADLNYCEGLLVFSKYIGRKLEYYARLSKPKYRDVFEVEKGLYAFLEDLAHPDRKNEKWKLGTIKDLFSCALAYRKLPPTAENLPAHASDPVARCRARVLQSMEPVIAKFGKIALSEITADREIWEKVIQQKPIASNDAIKELSINVRLYLAIEITNTLYFPEENAKENHKLNMALFLLQHVPSYKELFEQSKRADLHFAAMIDLYLARPKQRPLPQAIYTNLAKIFLLLYKNLEGPIGNTETIFFYAQSCQLIANCRLDVTDSNDIDHDTRAAALQLLGFADDVQKRVQERHTFPKYSSTNIFNRNLYQLSQDADTNETSADNFRQLLFSYLAQSLYGDPETKQEAQTALHDYFETRQAPKFKMVEPKLIKFLIPEYVLSRIVENKELCPFEVVNIRQQMHLCFHDIASMEFYKSQHDAATLNLVLSILIEDEQSRPMIVSTEVTFSLATQTKQRRGDAHFKLWQKLMGCYKEWRFAIPERRPAVAGQYLREFKEALELPDLHPEYKEAFVACYTELTK